MNSSATMVIKAAERIANRYDLFSLIAIGYCGRIKGLF